MEHRQDLEEWKEEPIIEARRQIQGRGREMGICITPLRNKKTVGEEVWGALIWQEEWRWREQRE